MRMKYVKGEGAYEEGDVCRNEILEVKLLVGCGGASCVPQRWKS